MLEMGVARLEGHWAPIVNSEFTTDANVLLLEIRNFVASCLFNFYELVYWTVQVL